MKILNQFASHLDDKLVRVSYESWDFLLPLLRYVKDNNKLVIAQTNYPQEQLGEIPKEITTLLSNFHAGAVTQEELNNTLEFYKY